MRTVLVLIIFLKSFSSHCQNLVVNPSFEDTIPCAVYPGPPSIGASNWYWATGGSADYFSEQLSCFIGVPNNSFGFQYARTAISYVGLACFISPFFGTPDAREYLGGSLTDSLVTGHTYCISLYVSCADDVKYVTDDIGLYLSVDSIYDANNYTYLSYTPQVENPQGNIIYDTLNWVQISGNYTALGGEKYLTIGNFKNDSNTTIDSLNNNAPLSNYGAYYYIDDVSVVDCTVGIEEVKNESIKLELFPNPAKGLVTCKIRLAKGSSGVFNLVNVLGYELFNHNLVEGNNYFTIDLANFSSGIYSYLTNLNNGGNIMGKLSVIK